MLKLPRLPAWGFVRGSFSSETRLSPRDVNERAHDRAKIRGRPADEERRARLGLAGGEGVEVRNEREHAKPHVLGERLHARGEPPLVVDALLGEVAEIACERREE